MAEFLGVKPVEAIGHKCYQQFCGEFCHTGKLHLKKDKGGRNQG